MKRVLITGVGGSIGIHVLAAIMEETDWEVVGIDSFNHHGYFDRLPQLLEDSTGDWRGRLQLIRHDLTAPFTDREVKQIGPIDYVINLASRVVVGESLADPLPFIRNNIELQLQMMTLAQKLEPSVFLHFSTDEVYGPAAKHDHKEWSPLVTSSGYSASKGAQELIAISYWSSFGLPLVITNSTNNFGEMAGPQKFSTLVQRQVLHEETVQIHAGHNGELGTRYYIHSRDTADALLFLLRRPPTMHVPGTADVPDRYNIVGETLTNNLEMAELVAEMMSKPLHCEIINQLDDQPGHDLHYGLDGTKLAGLGWKAKRPFATRLAQVVDWNRSHPGWL